MKKTIAALVLTISTLFATGCGSDENIGYIDQQKILTEAPQITKLVEEGSKKADEIEAEAKGTLDSNPEMSDEDRQKALEDFERKMMGIQTSYSTQIKQKLDAVLVEICNSKNITVVFEKSTMLNGGMDITDEVIQKLK